jgi:phosphate transport system protein
MDDHRRSDSVSTEAHSIMEQHTVRAYDQELDAITAELARMGGLAEAEVADAIRAISKSDISLATSVIGRDAKLDVLDKEIERRAIRLIALRQPVADDLRHTVSAMKISTNLERIGDLAKNIAKRALVIVESEPLTPLTGSIERMGDLVVARLKNVLDALSSREVDQAIAVWMNDHEVDEHYDAIFRELLTYMMGDPRTITACAHLLFVAKNLERIGDHATNIAEVLHYEITGVELTDDRPKSDALARSES